MTRPCRNCGIIYSLGTRSDYALWSKQFIEINLMLTSDIFVSMVQVVPDLRTKKLIVALVQNEAQTLSLLRDLGFRGHIKQASYDVRQKFKLNYN